MQLWTIPAFKHEAAGCMRNTTSDGYLVKTCFFRPAAHLGTNACVKEAAQVGPQVTSCRVAKEVLLCLAAATGVDVRLYSRVAPTHQAVRHIPEQLCLDSTLLKTCSPDVPLKTV